MLFNHVVLATRQVILSNSLCLIANVAIVLAFCKDQLSKFVSVQFHSLEFKHNWLANDCFLLGVSDAREEWVLQALLERYTVIRVEDQDFLEEVDSLRWRAGVFLLQIRSWNGCKLFEVLERL